MGSASDMSEYLGIFLSEAEEQVETLDSGLLRLEKEPNNQDLLQEIFRAAHSLKGAAAAMGFTCLSKLCHAAENVLDKFRSGEMSPTTAVIDPLLAGVDALKVMKESIRGGAGDQIDISEMVAALEAAVGGGGAGNAPAPGSPAPQTSAEPGAVDALDNRAPEPGIRTVTIRLAEDCQMHSVRAFLALAALEQIGKIVRTEPERAELEAGRGGQEFKILMGECEAPAIQKALSSISEIDKVDILPDERVVNVGPEGRGKPVTELAAMSKSSDQTVRVSVARLDALMNLVGELVIDRTRVSQLGLDLETRFGGTDLISNLKETSLHMGRIVSDIQEEVMKARMLPIAQLFNRFPRMIRDYSHKMGKEIELTISGEDTELDRSVIEEMVAPLDHLLRNAMDHGIESPEERERAGKPQQAEIKLTARQEENHIIIEVREDGAGINVEKIKEKAVSKGLITQGAAAAMSEEEGLQLIFLAGLSTAKTVSDVSGRGVGMDVVKTNVAKLHGSVRIQTKIGRGTTVAVRLPLTLAISQALLMTAGKAVVAVPLSFVDEITRIPRDHINTIEKVPVITYRNRVLPLIGLRQVLGGKNTGGGRADDLLRVVVVRSSEQQIGLLADDLLGEQEIVLKPLGSALGEIEGLAGATILGDGTVALVLDIGSLMERTELRNAAIQTNLARSSAPATN
jgi:two-component system, chemotaxis family, sensor kinase CheA